MKDVPLVPLGEVATSIQRSIEVLPGKSYRTLGVKWWGEGAYERETIDGSQTAATTLNEVRENDLIINKIWVRHGSVAIAGPEMAGCAGSNEFPTFILDEKKVLPRWVHWYTKTRDLWNRCDALSQGTSGKNRIRPERFLTVEIPLPPLPEQRRIVAKVEELAAKIDEANRLRQSTDKEAGYLLLSAQFSLFAPAHNWSVVALGDVADIRSGVTLGRDLRGSTVELPYLRVANVQDGHLDLGIMKTVRILESERDKWLLASGDILLTEGGDWDKLGRGTVWMGEIPNCIHQNHIFRVRVNPAEFDPFFLSAVIGSPHGKAYFQAASKQTTNLASINQRQLKAFPIYQPPLSEQRRIVAYLGDLQSKVDSLKALQSQSAAELDALLPSILDKAFKGEL
ncbi:MAG: restriction endonuclease subunit S [Thermoguttaceae bacterium]